MFNSAVAAFYIPIIYFRLLIIIFLLITELSTLVNYRVNKLLLCYTNAWVCCCSWPKTLWFCNVILFLYSLIAWHLYTYFSISSIFLSLVSRHLLSVCSQVLVLNLKSHYFIKILVYALSFLRSLLILSYIDQIAITIFCVIFNYIFENAKHRYGKSLILKPGA